jgi:hypothetical protein
MIAAATAGCSSTMEPGGRLTLANGPISSGATVAFESIDGPPPAVFGKLVATLNDEANARHVTVVSRSGPATYRVRAYVSAMVNRGNVSFGWVWDVYDADKQRALRVTGVEPAEGRHRDAWAAADEQVLRRIARTGMERVAAFLNEPQPQRGTAFAAVPSFMAMAAAHDDTPEAAGIVRQAAGAAETAPAR